MPESVRRREVGRGERVLPGVWRLRLPVPYPGVPHVNAWALAAGDGIVLVDCGIHEPGSLGHLERALAQCNLRLEHVRLLVITHAHSDHYGQAATVVERSGCELWMHPDHRHMVDAALHPEATLAQRLEVGRQSGVPEATLRGYAERKTVRGSGIAAVVAPERALVPGVEVSTDLGTWTVHDTPGHAPSHVCLFQPERRLLISGDHLLGRVSLYYEWGYSRDPAGEFLTSLDEIEPLRARLCLSGHGRTFTDVQSHIDANRRLVDERLDAVAGVVFEAGEVTAFDAVARIYGDPSDPSRTNWWLTETLAYLRHLEVTGRIGFEAGDGGAPDRWVRRL